MKIYDLKLTTTGSGKTIEHTAFVKLGSETTIRDLRTFEADVKSLYREAMKAKKRGDYLDLEIAAYTWDGDQINEFDCWEFHGYNDDPDGIYLAANAKYTDPCKDLYLTKDIMNDLTI